jgi:hypothetical protein
MVQVESNPHGRFIWEITLCAHQHGCPLLHQTSTSQPHHAKCTSTRDHAHRMQASNPCGS